jgi:ACR3 family arsenite efflux pump ArsB
VHGTTVQHAVWTGIGAVVITIWPALVGRRGGPSSALVQVRVSATVTVVFSALLGWFVLEAWLGNAVGLAERVASSVEICWPFVVAVASHHSTARNGRWPAASAQPADAGTRQASASFAGAHRGL